MPQHTPDGMSFCDGLPRGLGILDQVTRRSWRSTRDTSYAWADVLTKRISHRNALHDAATAQASAKRWRDPVVSLSAWEQQALDSIKEGLAGSDPMLVERLTIFTRLASDEEMPTREKIHVGSRRPVRGSRPEPPPPRRVDQRLGLPQAALLLWLVTTLALIVVALAYSRGGSQDPCTGTWATFCTGAKSTTNSASGIP